MQDVKFLAGTSILIATNTVVYCELSGSDHYVFNHGWKSMSQSSQSYDVHWPLYS